MCRALPLLLVAGLAASSAGAQESAEKLTVLVPNFKATSEGIGTGDIENLTALTVFQVAKVKRFDVISGNEIQEMLRLEENRALSGCTEASCLSELADAFNARLIVTGLVGRLGPRLIVNLSLIDSYEAKVKGRASLEVKRLAELPYQLRDAVDELTKEFGGIPGLEQKEPLTDFGKKVADVANRPDTSMLMPMLLEGALGIFPPAMLGIPFLQAYTFYSLGGDIAGRTYPNWWWPIWTGFLGYGSGLVLGGAVAFAGNFDPDPSRAALYPAAGVATFFAAAFLLEPLVAWGGGIFGAEDLPFLPEGEVAPVEVPAGPPEGDVSAPAAPAEALLRAVANKRRALWRGPPPLASGPVVPPA